MAPLERRTYGLALVTIASVFWSTAGLFVRMLDVDLWTMLVWRSLFAALSLALVAGVQTGWRLRTIASGFGWPGLIAVPISAVSMVSYVAALKLTSVTNVLTVYATVPFIAGALAFVWLGETVRPRFIAASAIALIGIVIITGSATRPRDLAGNAFALLMTVTFAIVLVMARRYPLLGLSSINSAAAGLCALACLPLASGAVPELAQLVVLAAFGVTTTALAYLLFLTGGRHIPSGEAGLLGLLDVVLGPLWVWLAFSERPSNAALLGGSIVIAAVVWYLSAELRRPSAARGT